MNTNTEIEIEPAETASFKCPCCGRDSETVHGFIYAQDRSTSVYFAGYTYGHADKYVNFVLSIGGWGEGTTPSDRKSVAMRAISSKNELSVSFPDPETSPWNTTEFLGQMLNPDDLSEDDKLLCQTLAHAAITKDNRIYNYLNK